MTQNYFNNLNIKKGFDQNEELTMEELYECYNSLARIVKKYGNEYLPLFERVHNEIERRKKKNRLLDIAMDVANKSE